MLNELGGAENVSTATLVSRALMEKRPMLRLINLLAVAVVFVGCGFVFQQSDAKAQVVTTYYPAQPAVSYVPTRAGLFGRRVVYRPVVSYPTPVAVAAAVPTVSYYSPAPVTAMRVVTPAPVVTRRVVVPAPVTTYYAPTYYAPVRAYRPVIVVP